jgi:hypothetical protein
MTFLYSEVQARHVSDICPTKRCLARVVPLGSDTVSTFIHYDITIMKSIVSRVATNLLYVSISLIYLETPSIYSTSSVLFCI